MPRLRLALPILFAACFYAATARAQTYKTAAGIRIESGLDLTFQQYVYNGWTAEGIIHTSMFSKDVGFTVLAEKHHKILTRNLNFYVGPGLHYYTQSASRKETDALATNVFGVSAIGGIEFSVGRVNLAVDWKPELHLAGEQVRPFEWHGTALSVRYIFAKRERKKVRDWKVWDRFPSKKRS